MSLPLSHAESTDSERIIAIETTVFGMSQRLYGNGQPGDIDKIYSKIESIERFKWQAIGALGLISGIPLAMEILREVKR